jgi:hypothetical protein
MGRGIQKDQTVKNKLKIPKAAMPVVRILRRDVPRPKELPRTTAVVTVDSPMLRFCDRCPMGMHPQARHSAPETTKTFPPCKSNKEIEAFYIWWDAQTDAKAATDAVWPVKGGE